MSTARFLVCVTSTINPGNRIERVLKRADESRAVAYARKWIRDVQRVAFYCGTHLNQYEVYGLDTEGQWRAIELGVLPDAEMGWPRKSAPRDETQRQEDSRTNARSVGKGRKQSTRAKAPTTTRAKTEFGYGVTLISKSKRSPLHERIEEAKRIARERLAEQQRNKGG